MSIYVNLRSSECKDIYAKNHGGNFQIELNEPLRLYGAWEVALAEMTYHSQAFPNLPAAHSAVEVTLKEQLQVYDTKDKDLSIKLWVVQNDVWVLPDNAEIPEESRVPHVYSLPKKNFDWEEFKEAVSAITSKVSTKGTPITHPRLKFIDDNVLECVFNSAARTSLIFSPDLAEFLTVQDAYQPPDRPYYYKMNIAYTKPILPKDRVVIWPDNMEEELWVQLGDLKIDVPKTTNSIKKLELYFKNLTTGTKYEHLFNFRLIPTEKAEHYDFRLSIEFLQEFPETVYVHFSPALRQVLHFGYLALEYPQYHSNFREWASKILKVAAPYSPLVVHSDKLPFNFYPTPKSMIDAINELILKSSAILNSKPIKDTSLFSLDDKGVCIFTEHDKIGVVLSPYLNKLLHMRNTNTSPTGSALFVMPSATREFLYVHTDMLDSRSYNNESNVLRVINNDGAVNDKVMVSFQHLHYYPISVRYLSNIQIRITDNYSDEDLPFALEVTCLLHFRRCNNHHHFS